MAEDREYEDYEIEFSLRKGNRKELKDITVKKFLEEKGGYWKENTKYVTRYKYFVETLDDGRRIYLLRPAFLNKGIDFQVTVERYDGIKDKKPSHDDIFSDLKEKAKKEPKKIKELIRLIDRVWNCEDPEELLTGSSLKFKTGFSTEMLLKILKWLFIEQDITYWNYDGRQMLRRAIDKELNQSSL